MSDKKAITEALVLDFRGHAGLGGSFEAWTDRLADYRRKGRAIADTEPSFALFGSAACEKMLLLADTEELLGRMEYAAKLGMEPMLELPPIHQSKRQAMLLLVAKLSSRLMPKALLVNDIGSALLMGKAFPELKLQAGRAFDKTVRENRFDIRGMTEFRENFELISSPALAEDGWQELFGRLGIDRITVDTLPDGKLVLPVCQTGWDVIYPRISISKLAKCEYAEQCDTGCKLYRKSYCGSGGRELYRMEHELVCMQRKALEDAVSGSFRLIYSEL